MKKILLISLISISIFGCSSLELESISSSEEETQKILALGLTHEENLIEAKKLKGNHLISVVTLQLNNARDEKIQSEIDQVESKNYAEIVKVSQDGLSFIGPEVVESISTMLSSELNIQKYYLSGFKDSNHQTASHKLNVTFEYISPKSRNYNSANFCDKWSRCNGEMIEIILISVNASECTSYSCKYKEVVELELSDEFLKNSIKTGLKIGFYSNTNSNKINISKAYLMGYLSALN